MNGHLIDTHLLIPKSRSFVKVKVKYHGHISQKKKKNGRFGALGGGGIPVSKTNVLNLFFKSV